MRTASRTLLSTLTAIFLLSAPAALAEENGTERVHEACDFNYDGTVDAYEKEKCAAPTRDRCDFDGDGRVDEHETAKCAEARDLCDFDGDGAVSDREKAWCPEAPLVHGDACDRNADGRVGPREAHGCAEAFPDCDADGDGRLQRHEREACFAARKEQHDAPPRLHDRCDLDGDGNVTEGEAAECKPRERPPPPDHAPPAHGLSEECRAEMERLRAEREAFHADMKARWEAFSAEQREAWEAFTAENRTEEEIEAFRKEQAEAHRAFEEEMRAKAEAFEHGARPEACVPEHHEVHTMDAAARDPCHPDPAEFERFRILVEEEAREFRDGQAERIEKLKARLAAEREEFLAGNRTSEEIAEFEAEQAAAHAELAAEVEEAAREHRLRLEERWQEFKSKQSERCLRTEEPKDVRTLHEEKRDARFACRIDAQAELEAFYARNGRDASNWTDAQTDEFVALRTAVRGDVRTCEIEVHEAWKEEAKAVLLERPKKERFGHFEMEPSGDGSGTATGRYVSFEFEVTTSMTFRELTVAGLLLAEEIRMPHTPGEPDARGDILEGTGVYEDRYHGLLRVRDNPAGGVQVVCAERGEVDEDAASGDPQACWLALPDGAEVEETEDQGGEGASASARYVVDVGGKPAVLHVAGPHFWDDERVEFFGALRLHKPAENYVHEFANKHRDEIRDAVVEGKVLAEVDVVVDEDGEAAADTTDYAEDAGSDTAVEVETPADGDGVTIELDAEANAGKTTVFNLDAALFAVDDLSLKTSDDFEVAYYEVADDGNETKVTIAKADSLADVLDPSEDAPEYWIVLDEAGVQLLVSHPHFSTKRVEVSTVETQSSEVEPVGGEGTPFVPVAGAVAALGAAAWASRRRRA